MQKKLSFLCENLRISKFFTNFAPQITQTRSHVSIQIFYHRVMSER